MRSALVAQWLRAGTEDRAGRRTAFRYAAGIGLAQVAWVARHVLLATGALSPSWGLPLFACLAALELAVPRWAERARPTSWHPHHIAERYGLFTIILLGEGVLATSRGVEGALAAGEIVSPFVVVAVSGLVLLFACWWLYFLTPAGEGLSERRQRSYLWGYGHYGVFAALAALGAGLEAAVERAGQAATASPLTGYGVGYAVAVPAAAYLVLLQVVHALVAARPVLRPRVALGCAAGVLALPLAAPLIGVAGVTAGVAAGCVLPVALTLAARSRSRARRRGRR
ncbi:low temperature requirement protein A [Actinomadura luzonensis]|uniref:low temperature requirement protein A n=1 Tax=Actinomadura luzonensis TaxID=2805427 RepID=UPI0020C800BB|nr:low temperature requirement protein A [Actinomadura luzonensis]